MLARAIILTVLLLLAGCIHAQDGYYVDRQAVGTAWYAGFHGLGQAYRDSANQAYQNYYLMQQMQMNQNLQHIKDFGIPRSY